MASGFDRDQLLAAFDEIGEAAVSAHRISRCSAGPP
jgi:hypothetical protein